MLPFFQNPQDVAVFSIIIIVLIILIIKITKEQSYKNPQKLFNEFGDAVYTITEDTLEIKSKNIKNYKSEQEFEEDLINTVADKFVEYVKEVKPNVPFITDKSIVIAFIKYFLEFYKDKFDLSMIYGYTKSAEELKNNSITEEPADTVENETVSTQAPYKVEPAETNAFQIPVNPVEEKSTIDTSTVETTDTVKKEEITENTATTVDSNITETK